MYAGKGLEDTKPLTVTDFRNMREAGEKFACLTAYDASFAALEDLAGVDLIDQPAIRQEFISQDFGIADLAR